MESKTTGATTFQIHQEGKELLVFTDAAKAGEAWHKAEAALGSNIIMKHADGSARIYASTGNSNGQIYKDLPFDNAPGAAEFKRGFKESMERQKAEYAMPVSKADLPAIVKPEVGKTYTGTFVEYRENAILQKVTEGMNTYYVEHARTGLNSKDSSLLHKGKDVSIRYALPGIGVVTNRMEKSLDGPRTPEHQPKGFGGASRY